VVGEEKKCRQNWVKEKARPPTGRKLGREGEKSARKCR